jgi:DNA invertase Pin-like site-specific DNA recombinase
MKAILYARFSTDRQRDASIEVQFREGERAAKAAALDVVGRFDEKEISGSGFRFDATMNIVPNMPLCQPCY